MAKGGRREKYPHEVYLQAVELRRNGMQIKEIALVLNVQSTGTIHSAISRLAPDLITPRGPYKGSGSTRISRIDKNGGTDARLHKRWTGNDAPPVRPHIDRIPGSSILLPTAEQLRRGR